MRVFFSIIIFPFFFHLNHRDVKILLLFLKLTTLWADSAVDKLCDIFFFFFFAQKIGFIRSDRLHEMLKWGILFSRENKDNISKCCLQECLPAC